MNGIKDSLIALKLAQECNQLREFYPELCEYNKIKRIIGLANALLISWSEEIKHG